MKFDTSYIRIGLMGSSCSGKTTTARIISRDLCLELHDELESRLLSKWISKGVIKDKGDLSPNLSKKFQEEALRIRECRSKKVKRGISDRTAADLLVYNRIYVQPYFSSEYAAHFTSRCKSIMDTYTHLFLFPYNILPIKDNKFRTIDLNYQERIHKTLITVLNDLGLNYIPLSSEKLTIEDRVQEVIKWIKI